MNFRSREYRMQAREHVPTGTHLQPGHYRMRAENRGWLPVLITVENSKDDDGNDADRPRLVLYAGTERHERPHAEEWRHRIWAIEAAEYERLRAAHTPQTMHEWFNLNTAPSLW